MTGHGRGSKPRATCARKNSYRSEDQAKAVVRANRMLHPEFSPLRPYRCHFCDRWHLTSETRRT